MSHFPATTVKVVKIEPCAPGKVCITTEMVVDVHRLAEVGGDLLRTAVVQMKAEDKSKKKK
jgi:hypothetical protein